MLISLIVPCYNEEEAMPLFYKEASRVAAEMKTSHGADFEFIFVDDGSRDGTLRVARELHAQDDRVRYVSFSRNFGKEAGIYAGLKAAKGDYIATMDADLQDPPALLPQMLDTLLTGDYDCAATRRTTRKGEPPLRSWFARKFYQIINKMSDTEIVDGARDFRLMSRKMTDAVLSITASARVFSAGSASKPSGSITRTSSAWPAPPSGTSGDSLNTPSRASSASPPRRCSSPPEWACCSASWRSSALFL